MATKKKAKSSKASGKSAARKPVRKNKIDVTDPRQVRQVLVDAVLGRAQEVVDEVIEEAAKGNYLPAKFLFEFAGIAEPLPEIDDAAAARRKSLAEVLLSAVGQPVTKVANDSGEQPARG